MLTRRSEPGPSQSMEAQSGFEVKNDAMVFNVVDPSAVFVAYVVFCSCCCCWKLMKILITSMVMVILIVAAHTSKD